MDGKEGMDGKSCFASFCFRRTVSAVNIHSMLARFACSRASPVNSYG